MPLERDRIAPSRHVASGERIEWLDFLRGLSAFAIVLFHVRVTLWVGARTPWRIRVGPVGRPCCGMGNAACFRYSDLAVMLFFVVSGFAIHYPNAASDTPLAIGQIRAPQMLEDMAGISGRGVTHGGG